MEIKQYCAYDKLLQIALLIIEINPKIIVVNTFENNYLPPKTLANKRAIELFKLLVQAITILHYRQREKTVEGKYISEEEDNTTALSLLQQILPLPEFTLCESELILYKTLYEVYGTEKGFKMKAIINKRYYKTETTKRIIKKLKKMGLLNARGNRYKGYEYFILQ
jgi:DNA-binding MarR family transcriptional regulator